MTRFGAIPGGGGRGPWAPPPARALADGPPWILGWRGAPLDEPENTLVSFRRALALGLDGLAFELTLLDVHDLLDHYVTNRLDQVELFLAAIYTTGIHLI